MFQLTRYLKGFKRELIIGPTFKLTEAIFELIVPLVVAKIINVGIASRNIGYVLGHGAIVVLLGLTGLGCALVCQYLASRASQGFGTVVRNELFAHINSFSHAEIDRFGAPSLITRLTNDINQLQVAVAMLIRLVVRAPFLVVGSAIMALCIDFRTGLIFLIAAPLVALTLYLVTSRSVPFYKTIQRYLDRISLITRENLAGVRVIRAFSKQQTEQERFAHASDDLKNASIRVGRISALLSPLTFTIINLSIVAIVWFGGGQVDAGVLTRGEVYALINYMTQNLLALIVVSNLVVIFTKAAASGARVQEVFDTLPSVTDEGNSEVIPVKGAPRLEFRDVSFAYNGSDERSLSHLTLSVAPGETIGVIGGTGAGKSTLVNLIPRFYDVTEGELLLDGVNLRDYPFAQLRGQIGIVPQQALLFSGTLRRNLQWRDEDATDEEIFHALGIAQAKEFVGCLPDGLDTRILQGGKNLSGGQKQRLTIARALVGNPRVLILDDSASALDFATDAALRRAIRQETVGTTVFLVSQRVNTVKGADRIVVLDDGKVAGIGSHEQLFKNCPEYHEICLSQLSHEEVNRR